jgi:hypothetical protein
MKSNARPGVRGVRFRNDRNVWEAQWTENRLDGNDVHKVRVTKRFQVSKVGNDEARRLAEAARLAVDAQGAPATHQVCIRSTSLVPFGACYATCPSHTQLTHHLPLPSSRAQKSTRADPHQPTLSTEPQSHQPTASSDPEQPTPILVRCSMAQWAVMCDPPSRPTQSSCGQQSGASNPERPERQHLQSTGNGPSVQT